MASTGVRELDGLGCWTKFPLGAISELVGTECSGRTSVALSFVAQVMGSGNVCAWVDVSDGLDPKSAAAVGVDLKHFLWVRCGAANEPAPRETEPAFRLSQKYLVPPAIKKGLHGGGFGPHPRTEVKGISAAIGELLRPEQFVPRCAEMQPRPTPEREIVVPVFPHQLRRKQTRIWPRRKAVASASSRHCVQLDLCLCRRVALPPSFSTWADLAPEFVSRVPLATWFRYRAAVERAQACLLLLTQYGCAKSSGELLLRFESGEPCCDECTVFVGMKHRVEIERQRFAQPRNNVIPLRKPPQPETGASWRMQSSWAGTR